MSHGDSRKARHTGPPVSIPAFLRMRGRAGAVDAISIRPPDSPEERLLRDDIGRLSRLMTDHRLALIDWDARKFVGPETDALMSYFTGHEIREVKINEAEE